MREAKNNKFEILLNHISDIIKDSINGELTILLIGSYGRCDGSFDETGHPLRDIDLAIILKKNVDIKIHKVKQNLQSCNLLSNLVIDLHFYTLDSLINVLPFWRFYDIKNNSKLVQGVDIRKTICKFNSDEISKYDGIRMLSGELLKIMREGSVNENKLYFILNSAENIKNGRYGEKIINDQCDVSLNEFVNYTMQYYDGGYNKCAKFHLQPTINYIIKKKFHINIEHSLILAFIIQIYWTIIWSIKTKNVKVLFDWRDPAIRIYYSLIYYFNKNIKMEKKVKLFNNVSFREMKYSQENIIKIYDSYFLEDRWQSVRKSTWAPNMQVVIK